MDDRPPPKPGVETLNDADAARLLARASELDATRDSGVPIANLREAAAEAGISPHAFDAAVGELQRSAPATPVRTREQQLRRARIWAVAAVVSLVAAVVVGRRSSSDTPVNAEAILLRCLSPSDAAELVRPLLTLPTNSVLINPEQAPHVITIRATRAQLRRVKSLLRKSDDGDGQVCAAPVLK